MTANSHERYNSKDASSLTLFWTVVTLHKNTLKMKDNKSIARTKTDTEKNDNAIKLTIVA